MLTLITGGARSGKSSAALRLAEQDAGAGVVFVATATPDDVDMAARIAAHQAERPWDWATVEEPVDLAAALRRAGPDATVVVDCLTLWTMNMFDRPDDEVLTTATRHADLAAGRPGATIVVTNEVGDGIVPADADTRRYRDLLGRVNATWSRAADRAWLVVAGRRLELGPIP
ncbi:bifunctional adenosylcobinamide kinase/adenosylcobinamide-phosphate guanylyltransferase [Salsipaludibacter albus]|uniref:bifunctional adenosylcobinamide kinase/adenosylcobinamide-phosphate guanylyltransferase n=1 Tax=Salsipaludibacter albus TaxID=2849650 RepID=UPI001EE3FEAD|nr:bifunctional adenosylcobinamide kinase/adenosylcobinamide-phosphate guanylyltransferase [Salsipaludibacter albus]MBY5163746.1 bifunctional adenosylcobinamide kinase/adenosylcobinamide-phosphate guanylyltransferase [Salsipaludibacter albus]